MTIRAAILGFGTVGQGVHDILFEKQQELAKLAGDQIEVCGVLVQNLEKPRPIKEHLFVTDHFEDILSLKPDIVFEATVGEEPSFTYLSQAIARGIHIVTANKVMFAAYGPSLLAQANSHVGIGYEATTAAGTPIIGLISKLMQVNQITGVEAILNGTSNYILTAMQSEGKPFSRALQEAQERGYAEADPSNDIEGDDAFYKLMILSHLLYNRQPDWETVPCEGISSLTAKEIEKAKRNGEKIRHVAALSFNNGSLTASVKPVALPSSHCLYSIEGVDNAVTVTSDLAGSVTLRGPGAGKRPTASAMIEDAVHILQNNPARRPQLSQ
ncbi:homoserine dehydrogenase [Halobacillus sp. Marseille-Q1614]|uniref:homoserine dehydrogenase n=1 Tax=Halobacillus sp. Marseille-Q1614 TaxID=2709134 RepID=UPI00156E78A8|nr:homoserine dehydrogenase [Halobacillus sp. Marseille-Q1614]